MKKLNLNLQRESDLNLFSNLIIFKFFDISREFRLTLNNIKNLKIESQLTAVEKEILMTVLFNRKKTLFWYFSQIDCMQSEIVSLQQIHTVSYKTWQMTEFQISCALKNEFIQML